MKKTGTTLVLLGCLSAAAVAGNLDIQYSMGLLAAQEEYAQVDRQLDGIVAVLEREGLAGLRQAGKVSMESAYVIDPRTGRIVLGAGDQADHLFHINGRAVARAAIARWRTTRDAGLLEQLGSSLNPYGMLYSRLAITQDAQLFVVAAGRQNLDLEKWFVQNLINQACETIQARGLEAALRLFEDPDGEFRTEYTYVFVYEGDRCLFNPNYPELIGKTPGEMEPVIGGIVKKFLELAAAQGSGWQPVVVRNPVTGAASEKELYVKRISYGGRDYTVGSGLYVPPPAESQP